MELLVLVTVFEIKGLGRIAETDAKHVVNNLHHFLLLCKQLFFGAAGTVCFPQSACELPQLFCHVRYHFVCVGGNFAFRHRFLRNQSVFVYDCTEHIPLSAVI